MFWILSKIVPKATLTSRPMEGSGSIGGWTNGEEEWFPRGKVVWYVFMSGHEITPEMIKLINFWLCKVRKKLH
jgi:hypothetical protein